MPVASDAYSQTYTYKQKNTFQIKIYIAVLPDHKGWVFFFNFFFFYSPFVDLGEFVILSILKADNLTAKKFWLAVWFWGLSYRQVDCLSMDYV